MRALIRDLSEVLGFLALFVLGAAAMALGSLYLIILVRGWL